MELYLVLLSTILTLSLTSTEQYVSSPDSNINLSLVSMKNTSGHLIMKVDTGRYTRNENAQPSSENVHQEASNKTEQLDSVDIAHRSLHDALMSGAVQPTAASTSSPTTVITTAPKSCPQTGYQLYPGYNCYKAFPSYGDMKSWSEARQQCIRDGGDLMVMDSERELEDVYIPLRNSVDFLYLPWMGVYIPEGGNDWTTVKGEPVFNTWWVPGQPEKDAARKCAIAFSTGLLANSNCAEPWNFICEISL